MHNASRQDSNKEGELHNHKHIFLRILWFADRASWYNSG